VIDGILRIIVRGPVEHSNCSDSFEGVARAGTLWRQASTSVVTKFDGYESQTSKTIWTNNLWMPCYFERGTSYASSDNLPFTFQRLRIQPSWRLDAAYTYPIQFHLLMAIKIENQSTKKLPKSFEPYISELLEFLPREHLRGIERVRLVDNVSDVAVRGAASTSKLPGLYHPKQGVKPARIEIAVNVLLPDSEPFYKRLMPRLSFKSNAAAVLVSLVGQHYYLTLRHSVKRGQLEGLVRAYTEKQLRLWHETKHKTRAKIFKPIQPWLEKWGRALQKRAAEEKKRAKV